MTSPVVEQDQVTRAELPTTEWEFIDRERAEEYLRANEGNRKLRKDTVSTYVRDLEHGKWLVTGDAIRFDTTGRLIDGQHRLMAVAKSNKGAWFLVVRGVLPEVQRVLDTQAKRTAADALKFAGVDRNVALIASIARAAITYDKFMKNKQCPAFIHTAAPSNSEVEEWVQENPGVHEAAVMANHIHRAAGHALTAWGLAFLKFQDIDPVESREFFTSLANFQTRGPNDPRHTLLSYKPVGKARGRVALGEQLCAISKAWNAYRKGQQLQIIRTRLNGKYLDIPAAQ